MKFLLIKRPLFRLVFIALRKLQGFLVERMLVAEEREKKEGIFIVTATSQRSLFSSQTFYTPRRLLRLENNRFSFQLFLYSAAREGNHTSPSVFYLYTAGNERYIWSENGWKSVKSTRESVKVLKLNDRADIAVSGSDGIKFNACLQIRIYYRIFFQNNST